MSRLLICILLLLSFHCSAQEYPLEIRRAKLEGIYDKTRWFLYCIECDHKISFTRESKIKDVVTTFGMLPLKFDHLEVRGDTIEIDFYFYYKNQKLDRPIIDAYPYWGALYKDHSEKILMFSSRTHARYLMQWCDDINKCPYREQKPLQPEVIKYIKRNRAKLDPWFRQEAIKRGVIK